jgi:hypothetical protein
MANMECSTPLLNSGYECRVSRLRISAPAPDYRDVLKVLVSVLFAASLAPAQSKSPPPKSSPGITAQQDKEIEAAIRAKLAKSKIGKDGFTVHVQGGIAHWEGTTGVVQHKGSATRMAKTAGARGVVNNIKVTDAAKEKAAENLEQGRRRAQVKRSDPRTQ